MSNLIANVIGAENIRTLFIVLIIFLATYSKKTGIDLDLKEIKRELKKMADWLEIRIKKPQAYKIQMEEKALEGMSYFTGCSILRDILWFKMTEFNKVINEIHEYKWGDMNPDWIANLITTSANKVLVYIERNTKDKHCECCTQYYLKEHIDRTENLINTINEIVIDDVNSKAERLHYKALDFIHETISMFHKMEKKCRVSNKEEETTK